MGIQINGITDTISATDGSLAVSGQQLTGVTDINASGIVTSTQGYVVGTGASIFSPAANILTFGTNGSERVRVDSSGNLLVGTTTLGNNRRGVSIDSTSINIANNSGSAFLLLSALNTNVASNIGGVVTFNAVYRNSDSDSTQIAYIKGLRESASDNSWAGYLSFETSPGTTAPVERMRIDSSGRVGIGTMSPATNLEVRGGGPGADAIATISSNQNGAFVRFAPAGTNTIRQYTIGSAVGGSLIFYDDTANSQRAAIDSSGRLLVGTTTSYYTSGTFQMGGGKLIIRSTDLSYSQIQIGNPDSNGEASLTFLCGVTAFGTTPTSTNGDTRIWSIGPNVYGIGGDQFGIGNKGPNNYVAKLAGTTATTWTFSSDARLKNIQGPIDNASSIIEGLNPVYYTFKKDSSNTRKVGLTAQNVLSVLPEIVDVPENEFDNNGNLNYMGLAIGDLVPVLVAALKETNKRIFELEQKVVALESM